MAAGKLNITKKHRAVDCILEIRDARAPFTSSNIGILDGYTSNTSKLIVLNKSDLVSKYTLKKSIELLEHAGLKAVVCSALSLGRISEIKSFVESNIKPRFPSLGAWILVVGLPNVGKSTLINALKHHSFVVENKPGVTKRLDFFHVSQNPKIYCFDTPGIMLPKMEDPEINLKLAALGCINDAEAGEDYIADYILYRLNHMGCYNYVQTLGMNEPSDDISKIALHISNIIERKWNSVDPTQCYRIFINQFRNGHFGKVCLDDLSNIVKLEDLSDLELSEPPDKWTATYKVIHGI
ncbi:hypothetical protein BEWA_017610 [Theileria equi strain WA]|uniref:Mitochondrial GTPase 1 n=1 Tax=Theileria equi strain WA TaxID=1537102 RepID=L0ATQ7_THEEQ|nr:hypothetical protein BEWA_017610 [Theileria equi strain WA]AFZ78920.1 hypothetical protein BEWA_017610 [Theileria equi strain WA]|eukprot:XP_004828586.1 hypothetical protein BEWA_017610 [Theileria equi strain WA]